MKKALFFVCYLIGFLIGAMLLIFNAETLERDQSLLRYAMMAAGIIFIIPAIIQLISSLSPKKDEFGNILPRKWYTTVVAILALLWGIYILIWPLGYGDSLSVTLGVSLVLAGLAQGVWIIRTSESTFLRFVVPILSIAVGVVIIIFIKDTTGTGKADQLAAIISGIMLIVWGINGFFSLRSKRVVAAADKAAKIERKAEKEEKKAIRQQAKEAKEASAEKESQEIETSKEDEKRVEKDTEKETESSPSDGETLQKPSESGVASEDK